MKKNFMMLAAVAFGAVCLSAAEVKDLSAIGNWRKNKDIKAASGALHVTGRSVMRTNLIPIDTNKKYTLSIDVNAIKNTSGKASFFAGFQVYDAKKRPIQPWSVNVVPGTFTELAAAVKKGDTKVMVKDGSKFRKLPHATILAGAKADFSDLPNRTQIARGVKAVAKKGDAWEITLTKPAVRDCAAGTKIRLHVDAGYLYTVRNGRVVIKSPLTAKGTIAGVAEQGGWSYTKWPKSTAFAAVIILSNWQDGVANVIEYKNIKLTAE